MKKTLNIILFGRKKSYFVKCTLTLIGLYLGVLFWYFNVDYLGQPIQNALVLAVCSLICISVLVALYRIPEQLCVNSQIEKLLYFPVNPTNIIYLDAFSVYPVRAWLPCHGDGTPAGTPAARPSRSSRSKDSSSPISYAHAG